MSNLKPRVGAKIEPVDITGWLFGVWDALPELADGTPVVPVMLKIGDENWLAVFENVEKLRKVYGDVGYKGYSLKQIDDGLGFLISLPPEVRVIGNPYTTDDGVTRGTHIKIWKELEAK